MYIEMTCKSCNERFNISFDTKEARIDACPMCKTRFSNPLSEGIWKLSEQFYMMKRFEDTEAALNVVAKGSKGVVIGSDIKHLHDLYNISPQSVRDRMTSLLDLFYLLMYHDCVGEQLENLDATIEQVRAIFSAKVEANHKGFAELLESSAIERAKRLAELIEPDNQEKDEDYSDEY